MSDNGLKVVGKPVQRLDALGHVTGRTQFFEDNRPTGLLHLKMHRSERHHAKLLDVDISEALKVDGVVTVLTHSDVIRDGKGLEAVLTDGRTFTVKQVWQDPLAGVAVLRIDGRGLPALPLGESRALHVGEPTAVIGWPTAAASPPVPATIRATGAATGGNLAIDAPIQAENVGGPLVNARGQVVGIAAAHCKGGASVDNG